MSLTPGQTVIEGTWEEVANRATEFAGRRVRVTVLPESSPAATVEHVQTVSPWQSLSSAAIHATASEARVSFYD